MSKKLPADPPTQPAIDWQNLRQIVTKAGEKIEKIYAQESFQVAKKPDSSYLTEADLAAQAIISAGLRSLTPSTPIVSEEDQVSVEEKIRIVAGAQRYWLVDPLDGTREFVERTGEFTVNVALIDNFLPIGGLVYHPLAKTMFWGGKGYGSFRQTDCGDVESITTRPMPAREFICVVSRHHRKNESPRLLSKWPNCRIENVGSSLKFCMLAEGRADIYLRYSPTSLWDTAAAQAVLEGAGGVVVDLKGQPFTYKRQHLINPGFLAVGDKNSSISSFLD